MMKRIRLLLLTMLLTSVFCCTAFASTEGREVSSTENAASDVVYNKPDSSENINRAIVIPVIETFQVKSVRVYPMYMIPEQPGNYSYDEKIYVERTIPANKWGQNNYLELTPETTEKLLHRFDNQVRELQERKTEMAAPKKGRKEWRKERDCRVVDNYEIISHNQ